MIFLFTDFGSADPYVGQLKARLARALPQGSAVIDLLHEAPTFRVAASAQLLAALAQEIAVRDICIAVVDPGVGTQRDAVAVHADGKWFVGPDNGLLSVVAARAQQVDVHRITWRPAVLSASFHGRDLFAPVAARLAYGDPCGLAQKSRLDVEFGAGDLAQIIYIDHYGSAITGLRAANFSPQEAFVVRGRTLSYARTFAEAPSGAAFWYANSIGLVEIASNGASAAQALGLSVGEPIACTS